MPIGSISSTPFAWKRLEEAGLTDPLRQLEKRNIYLVSNDNNNRFIRMYAAEKLQKEVVFTPVPIEPPIFEVFKVKYVTPADPEKLKRELSVSFLPEKLEEQAYRLEVK